MKRQFFTTLIALVCLLQAPQIWAGRHENGGFYDSAKVTNVEPIYHRVRYQRPQEECYWQESPRSEHRSYTSVIGGGLIGGVIGNRFGKGHGKEVMTIAGTLLGASIGNDFYQQRAYRAPVARKVCNVRHTNHTREELSGYRVTYRYKGQRFERVMDHHPGRKLRVWVSVTPI